MLNCGRYESIKNIFKRDPETRKPIWGKFSMSEFEYLQDCEWTWTEKLDGMNIRIILDDGVKFRGRSDKAQIPRRLLQHLGCLQDKLDIEAIPSMCFYGEGIGAGIQKGGRYGSEQRFVLFDIKTFCNWTGQDQMLEIASDLGFETAPPIFKGTISRALSMVRLGLVSVLGDFFAEGLVGRPVPELLDRYGNRIIVKIKHRDFYRSR